MNMTVEMAENLCRKALLKSHVDHGVFYITVQGISNEQCDLIHAITAFEDPEHGLSVNAEEIATFLDDHGASQWREASGYRDAPEKAAQSPEKRSRERRLNQVEEDAGNVIEILTVIAEKGAFVTSLRGWTPGVRDGILRLIARGMLTLSVDAKGCDVLTLSGEVKQAQIANVEQRKSDLGGALNTLVDLCHDASYAAGWWHHAESGYPYIPGDSARSKDQDGNLVIVPWHQLPPLARQMITHYWLPFLGCKVALIHSETSEGLEGLRKGLMDDKLTHRLAAVAETSDSMIRQFDQMGAMKRAARLGVVDPAATDTDLGATTIEKIGFNATRPDHKVEARLRQGGKAF